MKNLMLFLGISAFGSLAYAGSAGNVESWRAEWLAKRGSPVAEAPRKEDHAEDVVDELRWTTLGEMEQANAQAAALENIPWSDSYWPHYAGSVAYRYADPGMKKEKEWDKNERYVVKNLGRGLPGELSPAEKYDRLVGDRRFTLTRWALAQGRKYFEKDGKVESWMGLCHGWAPAAVMEQRVTKSVTARAPDGAKILFYPADLHALATLLWAEGKFPMKLIGGRCTDKEPEREENGRLKSPDCLDTNPGTWHLAIVNQLAASRRALLFDASFDHEVWNYPIYKYAYHYVKEGSDEKFTSWEDAAIPLSDADRARAPRAEGATMLVRVKMEISYSIPRDPAAYTEDDGTLDKKSDATYDYELELNADGKILGGEWLSKDHPDFLWAPGPGAVAVTGADQALDKAKNAERWDEARHVPRGWRKAAAESSAKGQPLARVVQELLRRGR
jgi:hypothetical protein